MKILICGGSGFIGQCLTRYLLDKGLQVVILDRHKSRIISKNLQFYEVDLLNPDLLQQNWFEGMDAVINLSGKDIFTFWSEKNKKAIWDSRVKVNKNLVDFVSRLQQKPKVFVSAAAIGYYGDKGEAELHEQAQRGQGFLAELCEAWEREARKTEQLGIRSVQVRTAPVLEKHGGILKRILRSFHFGFSFVFGLGNQWFSWIHMDDLVRIYHLAVTDETLSGPVNASSPQPVRFRDFVNHIRKFKKAVVIPFPATILKILLKETADVVLFSQRVIPEKLLRKEFQFSYPHLSDALKEIFS